jgi:peptide deformylase
MAVRKIVTIPDPVLTKKTQKVGKIDKEIKALAQDLLDTVKVAEDPEGAGLAATQIGVSKRICAVRKFYEDTINPEQINSDDIVLINPKITHFSKENEVDWEGCLSVPDEYGMVERAKIIKVTAQDINGDKIKIKAEGFFARTIQHEIDHLDGVLFTSKVLGKTISQKQFDEIVEEQYSNNAL